MMISTVFVAVCVAVYLLCSSTTNAGGVILNETTTASAFQHKLDGFTAALAQIDGSLQSLKEQAHTWSIFRHHIDAWNAQMQALEHKLDLIAQRDRERERLNEQQVYSNRLTSLEFTLNHILSKVVYLSESCASPESKPAAISIVTLLRDVEAALNADQKKKSEFGSRLSNILRHVQNIGTEKCRHSSANSGGGNGSGASGGGGKLAKLMLPVGGCNATQRYNWAVDKSLQAVEQKLQQLEKHGKKNERGLEQLLRLANDADDKLQQWQLSGVETLQHCKAISGELTTFTGSSDLLLKRIELLVHDVTKRKQPVCRQGEMEAEEDEVSLESEAADVDSGKLVPSGPRETEHDDEIDETDEDDSQSATEEHLDADETASVLDNEVEFMHPNQIACHELVAPRTDGIYKLSTPELNEAGRDFNERFCVFATDGPAWTVIQNRGPYAEQENFNRSWAEYRAGFGRLDKDFWFGNEFLHQLVYRSDYELRIELEDFEGVTVWAEYDIFRVDSERYNYNLLIGGFRGNVPGGGDSMKYHNEQDFSTYDRRNDKSLDACCSCATGYASGWWFDSCSEANLNGVYRNAPTGHNYVGIIWEHWHGDYSLKKSRMMMRIRTSSTPDEYDTKPTITFNADP